jgi:hypothetical protein
MSSERNPYSNVNRPRNRSNQIDMREVLKREIYKQGYDSDTNFRITNPPILSNGPGAESEMAETPAETGFEDIYIYFDSTQSDGDSDYANGEIKWSITSLNNSVDIKNCVAIRIDEFYFPTIYNPTTNPDYFYYLRVFIEVQNVPSTQSILGPKNNKFHFECDVQNPTGQAVKLVPINNTFYFQRPLISLSDFQLRFLIPPTTGQPSNFKKIPIPNDTVSIISLLTGGFGFNPIRFQITGADTTSVLGLVGVPPAPGIAIFISGYTSNIAAVNTAVNNTLGIFVTQILSSTTFEVAGIDASAVTAQYAASMFIPKNRIAFPVRFTSVRNKITNYLDISHD